MDHGAPAVRDTGPEDDPSPKRHGHMAKQRVRGMLGGTCLLQSIRFCRRWRRCPAWLRFLVWVFIWFLCLELLLPQRLDFSSDVIEGKEGTRGVSLDLEEISVPTLAPLHMESPHAAALNQETAFNPATAAVNDESVSTSLAATEEMSPNLLPVVEKPPAATMNQEAAHILTEPVGNLTPPVPHVMVDLEEIPGNCATAVLTTSALTQACCKTAVDRLLATVQMRSEFLRNARLPFNVRQWWQHLAPPVRRLYEERQAAFTAGQRWSGIAVLIAGQVRDGTKPHIVENIHKNLFKELIDSNIRYHIFAVLEYTRNGFSWRGRKNESRNFNDNDVRRVLERYGNGGNFTLLEWDEDDKQRAEAQMLENCTWRHFVGQRVHALPLQYVKISAALHLMRQAEEKMGTRFALVVRIRPDVTYSQSMGRLLRGRLEEAKGPVNVSVPSMCGAIGGGLGDAILVADRCSAEALHAVAPAVQGCRVEVDDCQSWGAVKNACLQSKTLATGPMLQELCGHGWIPTVLRYGVPTTSCGIGGQLGSPI
eukprot:s1102_g8.t2